MQLAVKSTEYKAVDDTAIKGQALHDDWHCVEVCEEESSNRWWLCESGRRGGRGGRGKRWIHLLQSQVRTALIAKGKSVQ